MKEKTLKVLEMTIENNENAIVEIEKGISYKVNDIRILAESLEPSEIISYMNFHVNTLKELQQQLEQKRQENRLLESIINEESK